MKPIIIIIICALILSGCATLSPITKDSPDYRIRPNDELRIVIWKELDEKVIVRPDGRISLPLIGEIYCNGKTPVNLSDELTQKYKQPTTVIVTKIHSAKEDLKDLIGFLRDIALFYLLGERIARD
jgi:protein involved in polysaccharide export with SLBB domain